MTQEKESYEDALKNVNTYSSPSDLRITDLRIATIVGAPFRCPLIKISTNQGIEGYGEVRDGASGSYALMLKSRILGENPCNVDKIFRKIKQFGHHGRQGGGVCGIEVALWDLAGKAYGAPVYAMLGGKFRDRVRIYCDTHAHDRHSGTAMGEALKKRMEMGIIEVAPLAYMRGRTVNNSFVILDEAQNTTLDQMKMFLTRLGFNSKVVITGDITQIDLAHKEDSGLVLIQAILKSIDGIRFIYLTEKDVVRHRLVQEIIKAFDKHGPGGSGRQR